MNVRHGFEDRERKDLPDDATNSERLDYIKNLAIFNKAMFGSISYNDIQELLDKIIKICK